MEHNNKRDNSLFALEKGLRGNKSSRPQSQQLSAKKRNRRRKEARAFDRDESIELLYNGDAFPTASPEAMSFSDRNSFASELEDKSLPFEVEAFEVDEEVAPVSKQVTTQRGAPLQPGITEDVTSKQLEVQPVKATVVSPSEMSLKSARPVKQPSLVDEASAKEKLSDAEAFAADLQAILNREKTYDPEQQQVVSTSSSAQPEAATPTPPQLPAEPEAVQTSRSHAVFDQMGKDIAHATDFNQGTVDLAVEQRFDKFDRILDEQAQEMTVPDHAPNGHHVDKVEEETLGIKKTSVPLDMDEAKPQGDHGLMPQALETNTEKDNEQEQIPVDVWF